MQNIAEKWEGCLKEGKNNGRVLLFENQALIDQIINGPTMFGAKKIILINTKDGPKLVSSSNSEYHAIIALVYMIFHDEASIEIIGGGKINYNSNLKLISTNDRSSSFGKMPKKILNELFSGFIFDEGINFEFYNTQEEKTPREYSYLDVMNEIQSILS